MWLINTEIPNMYRDVQNLHITMKMKWSLYNSVSIQLGFSQWPLLTVSCSGYNIKSWIKIILIWKNVLQPLQCQSIVLIPDIMFYPEYNAMDTASCWNTTLLSLHAFRTI